MCGVEQVMIKDVVGFETAWRVSDILVLKAWLCSWNTEHVPIGLPVRMRAGRITDAQKLAWWNKKLAWWTQGRRGV